MMAWMLSGETCWSAAAMAGSARCRGDGLAGREGLLRVEKAGGEQDGDNGKAVEMSEEAGADGHWSSPCVETKMLLQSYA